MKRFRFSRGIRGLCAALALCLALPGCAVGQTSADPAMKGWKQYSGIWKQTVNSSEAARSLLAEDIRKIRSNL